MEAFGLFNLLQSLLPKMEERGEMPNENPPAPPLSNAAPSATQTQEPPDKNACLDFLARHDERVKSVRKK